jgi:diguanylate cyclase (GGDEF)-like protein/PAS domain S-box-containing protein
VVLVAHLDDRAPATTALQLGDTGRLVDRSKVGLSGHPWHRWDDGRLWRGVYQVRSVMLVAFAAASWASGSRAVAIMVVGLVLPFNALVAIQHRRNGEAGWALAADQYLAGSCAIINPIVVVGVVVCQLVGAVTGAMGVRQRTVQPSILAGGVLLVVAGIIHDDRALLAFAAPTTLSTMAIARAVDYLKNRNLTANRRYEELLDGINAYVFETDFHSGEMLYMNERTRQIIGSTARSDQALLELVHPDDRHLAVEAAMQAKETGHPVTTEVRVLSGADTCHVELRTTVSTKGSRRRVRTVLIDVSDRKRAELELAHRAMHDPLTDLPNRALMAERIASALCTDATRCANALLLLDLNNFKRVNDALGHASGDLLLVELADRLRRITDPHDTVARLGGDEFAVLMPRAGEAQALEFANRCAIVLSAPWRNRGIVIHPKVSIGVAVSDAPDINGEALLNQADTAMYECKRTGADHVVYETGLEALNAQRLCLLNGDAARIAFRNRIGDRLPDELRGSELVEEAK